MLIIYILITLLIFSVIVVVHEAGHFAVAKLNGILVEEFAVGMGPIVFSKQVGETLYSVRAFPLGGFCRMLGEEDDSNDNRAFNNKSVMARMAVIFTGPLMNFIFGFVAVFIVTALAQATPLPVVSDVLENGNAINQGLEKGDRIIKLNNESINTYQDLYLYLDGVKGNEDITVLVKRGNERKELLITPKFNSDTNSYIIGFKPLVKTGLLTEKVEGYESMTITETVSESVNTLVYYVKSVIVGFVRLFTLKLSADDISGPIGIVNVVGETVETGIKYSVFSVIKSLLVIIALLNVNLGVINLFPIPAMDGGRLVFLAIEGLRRKPFDREKEGFVHFTGFVLLIIFMFWVAYNDIIKII